MRFVGALCSGIFPSEEKFAQPNIFIFHRDTARVLQYIVAGETTNWCLAVDEVAQWSCRKAFLGVPVSQFSI